MNSMELVMDPSHESLLYKRSFWGWRLGSMSHGHEIVESALDTRELKITSAWGGLTLEGHLRGTLLDYWYEVKSYIR